MVMTHLKDGVHRLILEDTRAVRRVIFLHVCASVLRRLRLIVAQFTIFGFMRIFVLKNTA